MRADRAKQLLKNGVYRAIGETVSGAGGLDGEVERTLRVLMYHKVNDLTPNPTTVPTAVFAEQMALLGDLGYVPVSLEQVRDHYVDCDATAGRRGSHHLRRRVPRQPRERAARSCGEHGYPAVIFVPIGFLDSDRPLPHEEALRALGVRNATVSWDELAALEAGGIRVESHGIGHRPVSELEPAEAAREIALSKLRLEERLGRPVDAYAFVKGSLADYRPEHVSLVQQAGYTLGFTSVSGANGPTSDRYRLRRYNVEPYPPRTFELVLAGACDLISVKDTVPGTYARRAFNKVLGTATPVSFTTVRYTPEWRQSLVSLLARVGTTQLTDEEFTWWFDRNPAGDGIVSLAVDEGEVVGVAAMSFFRTQLDGVETRLAIPVNVATDARYRGQGVFSTLEQENEEAAAGSGSPLTVTFPNANSYPIFIRRLGWIDLPRLRLWARPLRASAVAALCPRSCRRGGRDAGAGLRSADVPRARGSGRRALRTRHGRARSSRGRRLREPLLARCGVLQLALPRLSA